MQNNPLISFYLPNLKDYDLTSDVIKWQSFNGLEAWILQTYIYLRKVNFPCQIVDSLPKEGIVLGHRPSIPLMFQPGSDLLFVSIKADENPHPYAQLCVVQNKAELKLPPLYIQSFAEKRYILPNQRYFMPHWPQPNIISRDSSRGKQIENVSFFGIHRNLAREFRQPEWKQSLAEMGLNWCPKTDNEQWHDYSSVDLVIAIRKFNAEHTYSWKPASKLYNAWIANVPAIVGPEKAFQSERKSELDYIEVTSYEELLQAVKRLKDNPDLYQAMIENGKERAKEVQPEVITERWKHFLTEISIPAYEQWRNLSALSRRQYFLGRKLSHLCISNLLNRFS
ncbi:MAG: hypothetical protein AB4058_08875 [Microcystaceae cyanobacterium]